MNALKRLRVDHWAWIHAKIALIVWGVTYLIYPPVGPVNELGRPLNTALALFTICGSVTGVFGLVMSTDPDPEQRQEGLAIELSGLVVALCGPLTYFVARVGLIEDEAVRATVAAFGYTLTAFVIARIVVVTRSLKRGRRIG